MASAIGIKFSSLRTSVVLTGISSMKRRIKLRARSEIDQRNQLIFVAPAHQDGVEFDLIESGGNGGIDSLQNLGVKIAAGDFRVKMSIQSIE